MRVKERNRLIKLVLSKEFGYKNVRVRGGRGTAYGWVDIYITVKKPHKGECKGFMGLCEECMAKIEEVKKRAWEILEKEGLTKHLFKYYDDFGNLKYECIIHVKLDENVKEPQKREMKEVINDGYKIVYEGSWTWIYFKEKPNEEIREKLKSIGFRFSRRRIAWYFPQKIDVHHLKKLMYK